MKKPLQTDAISQELTQSVFFQKPAGAKPADQAQNVPASIPSHSPSPSTPEEQRREEQHQASQQAKQPDVVTDVTSDGMTLRLQNVKLKEWQEIIENTETQNSALRLTKEERYAVEDLVNELRRKYGIKTSMNEIARLGLLLLIHDFKQHKRDALIHHVKKA